MPALTAAQALAGAASARVGGPLLVNGAGGVTGGLIAALGRLSGARVIAIAGPSSAPRLKRLGVEELAGLLAHRKLEVSIGETYPLARAADALSLVTHGHAGGAVVLRL